MSVNVDVSARPLYTSINRATLLAESEQQSPNV
jgi:hypothetical protein